ncbi:RsmF rRNA methyltransferase first C-terminal domain-containing protein [Bacteroides sp. 519]|uniref:RsmF rRNA methyltransferase first C-terminal domain-containing protein n=1 Tax=Bacteroides sp. 519 TaxID=2302937 RepID=UPI0013D319B9|nr:RsmF rRNA methyltransferase first C-terminal domain-containing protein [Bacteroides sp. 519]NDV58742.1 rRNA cytosine-C5-methyltransferase [Bacteroides sp. 519]
MNLPIDFIAQIHDLLGEDEANRLINSLQEPSPVSIRINPSKVNNAQLSTLNAQLKRVPWCNNGYYLPERLTFTFDPLFHAGVYYVQEASSMFLEQAVKQVVTNPVLALDLCAAPGGKSTHLRSLLPDGSLLVANEVIRNRSQILAENITKWGHPDVMVTNNDPADFAQTNVYFDFILADVPCSGEGMFRKDEGAIGEWSAANVEICRQRQRRIIADIWSSLKPGGILVYSTCTFNTKENEENVDWITRELGATTVNVQHESGIELVNDLTDKKLNVYRFFPHKVKGEGFFMSVLQKHPDDSFSPVMRKSSSNKKNKKVQTEEIIRSSYYKPEQDVLEQKLRVLQSGISLGTVKGKDIIPSHALAMTNVEQRNTYPQVEVTYEQAISYLRRETIVLDPTYPKGTVLLTYKQQILGFVKNLGNRANNLYPQEWRIRSGYLPEEVKALALS